MELITTVATATSPVIASHTFDADITSFVFNIATLNLGYLTVSLALAGGLFYFFSVRPFQESLKKQKEEFELLKKEAEENNKRIQEEFNALVEKQGVEFSKAITEAKEEFSTVKKEVEKMGEDIKQKELERLWEKRYFWTGLRVPLNSLQELCFYMESSKKAGIKVVSDEYWLEEVLFTLNKIKEKENKQDSGNEKLIEQTLSLIEKIEGHHDKKQAIRNRLQEIFVEL